MMNVQPEPISDVEKQELIVSVEKNKEAELAHPKSPNDPEAPMTGEKVPVQPVAVQFDRPCPGSPAVFAAGLACKIYEPWEVMGWLRCNGANLNVYLAQRLAKHPDFFDLRTLAETEGPDGKARAGRFALTYVHHQLCNGWYARYATYGVEVALPQVERISKAFFMPSAEHPEIHAVCRRVDRALEDGNGTKAEDLLLGYLKSVLETAAVSA